MIELNPNPDLSESIHGPAFCEYTEENRHDSMWRKNCWAPIAMYSKNKRNYHLK